MERFRITPDAAVYFVTYSVVEWLPIFVAHAPCQIITDSLRFCHENKALRINAYVIMPTHMHAVVFDAKFDSNQLAETLTDFRKFTGRSLADYCGSHAPACIRSAIKEAAGDDRERRFWQPSRHPEGITTELFWKQKVDYLHENPCRKGLVARAEYWRFSSAGYLLTDGKMACDVPLTRLAW